MKRRSYLLYVVIAGICGALLRGLSLSQGFEEDSGLPNGSPLNGAVIVLCIAVAVMLAVQSRRLFSVGNGKAYEDLFSHSAPMERGLGMLCGVLVCATGVLGLVTLGTQVEEQVNALVETVSSLVYIAMVAMWLLTILAGISILVLVRNQREENMTAGKARVTVFPMFWACLNLVMAYHENSSSPVPQSYAYELLLSVAIMAAFYFLACFFYAECPLSKFMATSGIAVFLTLVCAGGEAVAVVMGSPMAVVSTGTLVRLIADIPTAFFLLLLAGRAARRCEQKSP